MVIADFNGDGVLDVFIPSTAPAHSTPHSPGVLLQSKKDPSAPVSRTTLPTCRARSNAVQTAAAADVDGDGATDLFLGVTPSGALRGQSCVGRRADGSCRPAQRQRCLQAVRRCTLPKATTIREGRFLREHLRGPRWRWITRPRARKRRARRRSEVLLNDGRGCFAEHQGALPAPPFGARQSRTFDHRDRPQLRRATRSRHQLDDFGQYGPCVAGAHQPR